MLVLLCSDIFEVRHHHHHHHIMCVPSVRFYRRASPMLRAQAARRLEMRDSDSVNSVLNGLDSANLEQLRIALNARVE